MEDPDPNSPNESGDPNSKTEEEPESFSVDPHHPEWILRIRLKLHSQEKALFKKFMSDNLNVFVRTPIDMPRIDPDIICHKHSIKVDTKPVKQTLRRMNEERSHTISNEIDCLIKVSFIRETYYPDWLSNIILERRRMTNGGSALTSLT